MAITRREFVTTIGALAAAVGVSQADISKLTEAFAGNVTDFGGTLKKPRVVWVHGAECTGCSTSLLSFLEDVGGEAIYKSGVTTGAALGLAGMTDASYTKPAPTLTLSGATRDAVYGAGKEPHANIADIVIDLLDIEYHETIMGMGGDLAAQWLKDFAGYHPTGLAADAAKPGEKPFVLVVEGALQDRMQGGAWDDAAGDGKSWCSIGMSDTTGTGAFENDMADTVMALATKSTCKGIIPIGQCACYGGYPGCKPQITAAVAGGVDGTAGFDPTMSQTGAMGVYDYMASHGATAAQLNLVYNVPGCPTNPWWFALTVVMFMINYVSPGAVDMTRDYGKRLKKAYPITVHSAFCPHYGEYNTGVYALKPGDAGCLQKLGCKGVATSSLCGIHGWNNQQPQNLGSISIAKDGTITSRATRGTGTGGHCVRAGAPCMGCTEKGYPDAFVPFVKR